MNSNQKVERSISSVNGDFPVRIQRKEYCHIGPIFESHCHEEFMILYLEQGEALIYCNSQPLQAQAEGLVIINSNDLHYGENASPKLTVYIIKIDLSFLLSNQVDLCQTKYMTPLLQNRILFQNLISKDEELLEQVRYLITEFDTQAIGYELSVKACIYRILVLLLRRYGKETLREAEKQQQQHTMNCLRSVLKHMEQHYNEKLSLGQLAAMVNMSTHHFCRLFKTLTGKPPIEYLNHLRLNKAVALLQESDLNISEVAMAVGFPDSNYFSRLFKRCKLVPPSTIRNNLYSPD